MKASRLVLRGLAFHRRTHLGVVAGCALSSAVLVGALAVGDSVRGSLQGIARARLGRVETAMHTGPRHFRDTLAARLGGEAAAALHTEGVLFRDEHPANRVQVYGIDAAFLRLAESPAALGPGDLALNEKLAAALGVKVGDEVSLRVRPATLLSRDAPLAARKRPDQDTRRGLFTVRRVLTDAELGRFSLKSDQAVPYNAFVERAALQSMLGLAGKANLLVTRGPADLGRTWSLEDAGLVLRGTQLESERIYLDPAVERAAMGPGSVGVLDYLVNSLSAGERSTPYSFMAAGPVPDGMKDDEIIVNRWVADKLAVGKGDRVEVAYSELAADDSFVEKRRSFTVRDVVEMDALAFERDAVPAFPGLTDVESCGDWEIGMPMDEAKLKDKDNEAYWKAYKQTPKAFVTLAAGRAMWGNRFGDLMAVRNPPADLRQRLDPADVGLRLRPVREEADRAVQGSQDLGQLFLGMSFFLIVASLLLTGLLFAFMVEGRAAETGTLLALGFTVARVRRLLLAEGALLAAIGALAGIPLGWGFARLLTDGLSGAWSGAVAGAPVTLLLLPGSAAVGAAAAAAISVGAMAFALRRQARRSIRSLVSEESTKAWSGWGWVCGPAFLGAAAIVATQRAAPAFFAAGAMALLGALALVRRLLDGRAAAPLSLSRLGTRRPGRATAAAAMIACGCFMVAAVSAMGPDLSRGTGGFEFYGESSLAVHEDLNSARGREAWRLTGLEGVNIVALKRRDGDDASCLNLNAASAPPLLGIDPEALSAFGPDLGVLLDAEGLEVPAIVGDADTGLWKLKTDLLDGVDEHGAPFKIRIVGSLPPRLTILQGRLLISKNRFGRLFPSEAGHRIFLVDVPEKRAAETARHLTGRLETAGLTLTPSIERLKEFHAVESAYLALFQTLGGLGLLLGTAGMAVLVARSVLERRAELALLRAVGFNAGQVGAVVAAEHRYGAIAGVLAGTAAAALAILPADGRPAYGLLAATVLLAWLWIRIAARLALRAPLLEALRNE